MFKSLSYRLTDVLINNKIIENEDFEIHRYGFETLIYFIVNISVALSIGIIFDRFIHTIVFLSCYCTLRQFTGGYHARNYTECTLTFAAIYLITIFLANNIDIFRYKYLSIIILIVSSYIIYKLAPLEHRNKPLSNDEKHRYRMIAMKIMSVIVLIFIVGIVSNSFVEYLVYSLFAIIWINLLLIVGTRIKCK